ncbi:MAG: hypothetical protein R2684_13480 [Pyrinomonadaceae bacterium]
MRFWLIFVVLLVCAVPLFGQAKTVTNSDLEKFRQKRLAAERDLRENYREMGFRSPEEMERENEKAREQRRADVARKLETKRWVEFQMSQQPVSNEEYYYQYNLSTPRYLYGVGYVFNQRQIRNGGKRAVQPGFISNPLIRSAWLNGSRQMRSDYRGNFGRGRN